MTKPHSRLSSFQLFAVSASSAALGTLCFAPFNSSTNTSYAISIIAAFIITSLASAIYMHTLQKHSISGLHELLNYCMPTILGKLLLFVAGLFFTAELALSSYIATDAINTYLLEKTPKGVILLALLITSCFVFDSDLQSLARCCEILVLLLLIPLVILLALCFFNTDISEFPTLLQPDLRSVVRSLPSAFLSCAGGAAAVIFISAKTEHKGLRHIFGGFGAAAVISSLLFICSVGIFTSEGVPLFNYPFIEMARSVSIGTISITERFDTIFIAVMIISVLLQLSVFGFCSAFCFSEAAGFRSHRSFSYLIIPASLIIAYYADNERLLKILMQISFRGMIALLIIFIPLSALAVRTFGRKAGAKNA